MRAGGFPGTPGGLVVSIVKTAGARAPAHQARGRGRRTWRPTERIAGARMVPPGEGNEARGDGRRGVGVSHSTAEAGELSPRDPVEGRGHRQVAPVEGKTANTPRLGPVSTSRQRIAELARQALGMAVAIAWLPGPAGTRRRVAKLSVEEPDAAEPARPDLWGARVSNDPGLPDQLALEVEVRPRAHSRARCSGCGRKAAGYDMLPARRFEFVPLWGIAVFLVYAMRRVACPRCGVKVETVPWAAGKHQLTDTYAWFLARWAGRLSWKEVAEVFQTSWEKVFRSVDMAVEWGRAHQELSGVRAIGIDEVAWQRGPRFLTLVYQIDAGCRRLLWVGQERRVKTLLGFFRWFGPARSFASSARTCLGEHPNPAIRDHVKSGHRPSSRPGR